MNSSKLISPSLSVSAVPRSVSRSPGLNATFAAERTFCSSDMEIVPDLSVSKSSKARRSLPCRRSSASAIAAAARSDSAFAAAIAASRARRLAFAASCRFSVSRWRSFFLLSSSCSRCSRCCSSSSSLLSTSSSRCISSYFPRSSSQRLSTSSPSELTRRRSCTLRCSTFHTMKPR